MGEVETSAFRELSLSGSFVGDDDRWATLPLDGWTFGDYTFTHAYPTSNGLLRFTFPDGSISWHMNDLYEESYMLAPYWCDHDTRPSYPAGDSNGVLRYGMTNIEGETVLAATWDNVAIYDAAYVTYVDNRRSRFQLIAYPSGVVEFNYDHIDTDFGEASEGWSASEWFAHGPVVGYYLPDKEWSHPASFGRISFIPDGPDTDPVYGGDYLKQGSFGFTDGGPHSLRENTNCGIPGRLRFSL